MVLALAAEAVPEIVTVKSESSDVSSPLSCAAIISVAEPVILVTPEAVIVPEVAAAMAVRSVAAAVPVTVTAKSPSIVPSSPLS